MAAPALRRLEAFAAVRAVTVASLAPLTQAQLDFTPAAGRWSIGEIADHLIRAEGLYRTEISRLIVLAREGRPPRVEYGFTEVDVRPLGLPVAVLACAERPIRALSAVLPDTLREFLTRNPVIPARNPVAAEPHAGRPASALLQDLQHAIVETRGLLNGAADLDLEAMRITHPLTGDTNVAGILAFLARHEQRHQRQMESVRTAARFPSGAGA